MANRSREEARKDVGEDEQLKGTFASVLMIGGFILVSWVVIFVLYWVRQ